MRPQLAELLRDPDSKAELEPIGFESRAGGVHEGSLVRRGGDRAYPVTHGVPCLAGRGCTQAFLDEHRAELAAFESLRADPAASEVEPWSFSGEWAYHQDQNLERTWGWTVEERVEQFLMETGFTRDEVRDKLVLDAGCGNGMLTAELASLDIDVVGIDFSTSVFEAEARRESDRVHYLQGDLTRPPFADASFDIAVSNGVLHHTPDTRQAFDAVARLVKPGGRFYLWLYKLPTSFMRRNVLYGGIETARKVISRLGAGAQDQVVRAYARAQQLANRARGKHAGVAYDDLVIGAYDSLTPRWRYFHEPAEVSGWFHEAGYGPATLTHWDNPWGFGMVATRLSEHAARTPGVNFSDAPKT